jgi:hypothetical protein
MEKKIPGFDGNDHNEATPQHQSAAVTAAEQPLMYITRFGDRVAFFRRQQVQPQRLRDVRAGDRALDCVSGWHFTPKAVQCSVVPASCLKEIFYSSFMGTCAYKLLVHPLQRHRVDNRMIFL